MTIHPQPPVRRLSCGIPAASHGRQKAGQDRV